MTENIERTRKGMDTLIDRTRDTVVAAPDPTERGVESAAKRVVERTHVAGERIRNRADQASLGAHRRLESSARALDRGYTRVRSDLSLTATAANNLVRRYPGEAVLIAASTGFVIGVLVRRRPAPV